MAEGNLAHQRGVGKVSVGGAVGPIRDDRQSPGCVEAVRDLQGRGRSVEREVGAAQIRVVCVRQSETIQGSTRVAFRKRLISLVPCERRGDVVPGHGLLPARAVAFSPWASRVLSI